MLWQNTPEIATNHMEIGIFWLQVGRKVSLSSSPDTVCRGRAPKPSLQSGLTGLHPWKNPVDVGWNTLYTSSPFHRFAIQSGVAPIDVVAVTTSVSIFVWLSVSFGFDIFWDPHRWGRWYSPKIWTWPVNFIHNHVDVSIDVIKGTIDIIPIVVYWVIHIIVPLFNPSIIVWMLHTSLYNNGKLS